MNMPFSVSSSVSESSPAVEPAADAAIDANAIETWITHYISDLLGLAETEIDLSLPFDSYGLDSAAAVAMTADLEDWLQRPIDPTLIYDYPCIEALAKQLSP